MKTRTAVRTKQFMVADFEIKAKDETARTFKGVLSTSHLDEGDYIARDIVWPGAFKRTLTNFQAAKSPYLPLVDSHNYASVLNIFGHMLTGEEVLTGRSDRYELKDGGVLEVPEMLLETEWQVIDGADGDRILDRLRPGSVRKMSMGYETYRRDMAELADGTPVRNLREVGLKEGSLVVFAMQNNAEADPASVKALLDAAREGALTDEEKAELRALLDPPPPAPAKEPPADDAPKGLAPDAQAALTQRLQAIKLNRLVARGRGRHALSA
jgi:HK97 family phage prohead protease